jgi:hypothetical protein
MDVIFFLEKKRGAILNLESCLSRTV